jgi:hypothetical protein
MMAICNLANFAYYCFCHRAEKGRIAMTKDGQNLYFGDGIMRRPNHERVMRMLHEMDFSPHEDRRHADTAHVVEHRFEKSALPPLIDQQVRRQVG